MRITQRSSTRSFNRRPHFCHNDRIPAVQEQQNNNKTNNNKEHKTNNHSQNNPTTTKQNGVECAK
jgi:hypothetical protein